MNKDYLEENPLKSQPITGLIVKFAIPSIVSGLVSALYNIVDQIFIGQGVGIIGNAATNVAFPLTSLILALALLLGVGTSANFSLNLGREKYEEARDFAITGMIVSVIVGVLLSVFVLLNLKSLILFFGASEKVMPLALSYTSITAYGIPFLTFTIVLSTIIRADGSPNYSMLCNITGAIINTILDPIFIFVLDMGIEGAAYATIIGQFISAVLSFAYIFRFKSVQLKIKDFYLNFKLLPEIIALGLSPFFNNSALMLMQITLNNVLTKYGALSKYGSEIPLASVGVISKVNVIYIALIIGICQGAQPIMGFNYGAKNYSRVKETFFKALKAIIAVSIGFFVIIQLFPREILNIFGRGNELYYEFGTMYFRIFMFMIFLNGIQPIASFMFTSIGKAKKGVFVSLTRQVLFLIPLIILFSRLFGIEGVLYAGPIADFAAAILASYLAFGEVKNLNYLSGQCELENC